MTDNPRTAEALLNFPAVIQKFDAILKRGLCSGLGSIDGQMCIEAAICVALDLPFGDDPQCVAPAVRQYKIIINDSPRWTSPQSRAEALRDIGIAQIGSHGVVNDTEFVKRLAEKTARVLIPTIFRDVLKHDAACMAAADRCEKEGTIEALRDARSVAAAAAADAAYAAAAAADAAIYAAADADYAADADDADADAAIYAAADAAAADAAYAAAAAARSRRDPEKYLRLSISLALEVLRELKSPGCAFITEVEL